MADNIEYPSYYAWDSYYQYSDQIAPQPSQQQYDDVLSYPPGTSFPVDYHFSQSPIDSFPANPECPPVVDQYYSQPSELSYPQYDPPTYAPSYTQQVEHVPAEEQWIQHEQHEPPHWSHPAPENAYSPDSSATSMDTSPTLMSPAHEYPPYTYPTTTADYQAAGYSQASSQYAQQETIQYTFRPDVHAYASGSAFQPAGPSPSTLSQVDMRSPPQWMTEQAFEHAHPQSQPPAPESIDVNPPVVPSQTDARYSHHHHPYRSLQPSGHDSLAPFRGPSRSFRPSPLPSQTQSQSVLRFGPGSRVPVKQPHERKPVLACLFCRGRKIACGQAHPGSDDRTCNQCARRQFECIYPKESRRGFRKGKRKTVKEESTSAPTAESSSMASSSSAPAAAEPPVQPKVEDTL